MDTALNLRQRFVSVRYLFLLMALIAGLTLAPPAAAQEVLPTTNDGVPGAPQAIQATAGDGRVTLAWTAPRDDGASPVTGYEYQVKECSGSYGAWTATDHVLATYQTVSGLTNGTEYTFRVRASSADGEGEPSAEAQATPNADFRPVITGDSTSDVGTTFLVTISFNRDVPELSRDALVIHGGHIVAHGQPWRPRMSLPNGREWTAHISPAFGFTGALTIDIPAGAVNDADGNPNLAAVGYTRGIKADHVRPRLYMDLDPVEGTVWYRDPLEPVSGPFTVRIKFVTDQVLHQPVTGLTVDEVKITNGTKTNFRQITSADGEGYAGDYEVTVTPDPGYTGPFTIRIDAGSAYACDDSEDLTTCDPGNLAMGDVLPLMVVA